MVNVLIFLFIGVFAAIGCGILKLSFKFIDYYFRRGDE